LGESRDGAKSQRYKSDGKHCMVFFHDGLPAEKIAG
jgi:hypothetical protein